MSQYETDREATAVGPELCPDCDHPTRLHGSEGCAFERGDRYESGYAPMAGGPCGCPGSAQAFFAECDKAMDEFEGKADATDYVKAVFEGLAVRQDGLRASRDTGALAASNRFSLMLLESLKGGL